MFFWTVATGAVSGATITVTWSTQAFTDADAAWLTISGADTASPIGGTGTGYNAASSTASASVTVGAASGSLVLLGVNDWTANALGGVDGSSTSLWTQGTDGVSKGALQRLTSLVGSGTYAPTRTLGGSDEWSASGVEIKAAAGGGAQTDSESETLDLEEASAAYGPLNVGPATGQTDFQWNAFEQDAFQIYGGVVSSGPSPQTDAKSETLTLSETVAAAGVFPAAKSETLTLSDTAAGGLKTSAVDSDTITLSDSLAAAAKFPATASDTITLSDGADAVVQSGAVAQTAIASDTVTLSDSMDAAAVFAAAKSETLTLSDAETAQAKFAAVEAETLTLSDSEVARLLAGANWAETVTISDAYTARGLFGSTWAETLTLSDVSTASVSSPSGTLQTAAESETITLGEASAAALSSPQAYAATHSEALALADAYEATLLRAATYESLETLTLGESSAARVMLALPVTLAVGNHVNDGEYVQAQTAVQSLLDLHHQAPTVTGAKGGNAALASLLSALQQLGILKDGST